MPSIVIIEPAKEVHDALSSILIAMGLKITFFFDSASAQKSPALKDADIVMADCNAGGLELAQNLGSFNERAIFIATDTVATKTNAMRALKLGAFDYLRKPLRVAEFTDAIKRGLESKSQRPSSTSAATGGLGGRKGAPAAMCIAMEGGHPSLIKARSQLTKIRETKPLPPILIQGEVGCGKVEVADYIFGLCAEDDAPRVFYACEGKSEVVLDRDLIGPDGNGGALFEQTINGMLVLENVDKLPATIQKKLVRVPHDALAQRMLVCTSNVNLEEALLDGTVTTELCYFLMDTVFDLPPLRERKNDIPKLGGLILAQTKALSDAARSLTFSMDALKILNEHDWPKNLMELEQLVTICALKYTGTDNKISGEMVRRAIQGISNRL